MTSRELANIGQAVCYLSANGVVISEGGRWLNVSCNELNDAAES